MSGKQPKYEDRTRENLLAIADAYARATNLSIATISRKFHGQQAFLNEFRAGKCSITASKVDAMLAGFRENWPAGLEWPELAPIRMGGPGRKISKKVGDATRNV